MKSLPTLLRLVLAAAVVLGLTPLTALPARAETTDQVAVAFTSLTPALTDGADPAEVITLGGTISNPTSRTFTYVSVEFWADDETITTSDDLASALAADATTPLGSRVSPYTEESGHVQVITAEGEFAPGATASFSVRATAAELGLAAADAVHLVGVHVRGIENGTRSTIGRGRTLLSTSTGHLTSATVVALTAAPDADLATELDGRLGDLLTAAEEPGVHALIDPALLVAVDDLARTHTVDGEEVAPLEAATDWAARVRTLVDSGRVMRLPYGNPDLAAADAAGRLDDVLTWAEAGVPDELATLPLAADLRGTGSADLALHLTEAGVGRVLAENTTGGATVVPVAALTQPGMGPGERDGTTQALSRRVAEEVVATTPRTYVVRTTADIDAALALPEQRTRVDVPVWSGRAAFSRAAVVDRSRVLAAIDGNLDAGRFTDDLTGVDTLTARQSVAAQAMSQDFATPDAAAAWLRGSIGSAVDTDAVTLTASESFVMGSKTNDFPVSVRNDMDVPVTVRLVTTSEAPQRITVPPTDFVTIPPGDVMTLNVTPEAKANGVVVVHAQLETTGGEKFGPVVPIEITATSFGRLAWVVIVVSGAVVLGGTALRIRAVQAEHGKERSGSQGH